MADSEVRQKFEVWVIKERGGSRTHPEKFKGKPENFIGHKGRKLARLANAREQSPARP